MRERKRGIEREKERRREIEGERETERLIERERERRREIEGERERERLREREGERKREIEREREAEQHQVTNSSTDPQELEPAAKRFYKYQGKRFISRPPLLLLKSDMIFLHGGYFLPSLCLVT